jgi:hypothetical protein
MARAINSIHMTSRDNLENFCMSSGYFNFQDNEECHIKYLKEVDTRCSFLKHPEVENNYFSSNAPFGNDFWKICKLRII